MAFVRTAFHGGILVSYHFRDMAWHDITELSIRRVHNLMYGIRHVPSSRFYIASVADIIPRAILLASLSAYTAFCITHNIVRNQERSRHAHQPSKLLKLECHSDEVRVRKFFLSNQIQTNLTLL